MTSMFITNIDPEAQYIWTLNNKQINVGTYYQTSQSGTYKVYTDIIGCGTPAEINLTNSVTQAPSGVSITATNNGVLCGETGEVILSAINPNGTVIWFKDNIPMSGAQYTGNSITLKGSAHIGTWYAVISDGGNCYSVSSNTVNLTVNVANALPIPAIKINGEDPVNTVYCKSGLLELKVDNVSDYNVFPGVTYQWFMNGNSVSNPSSESVCYVTSPATEKINISVSVNKTGYCSSSSSVENNNITLTAPPATNINGNMASTICGANPAILEAGVTSSTFYNWYRDGSFTGNTVIPQFNTVTPGKYRVSYKDANGCISPLSSEIPVYLSNNVSIGWVNLPPAGSVHDGDVITYSVNVSPTPEEINWTVNNGAEATKIEFGNNANIRFNNTGITNITVTAKNGCGPVSLSTDINVTSACTPISAVTLNPNSNFNVKEGVIRQITATPNGSNTNRIYKWYVDGVLQTLETSSIFNFSSTILGNHAIKVIISNCDGTVTAENTIIANVTVDPSLYADDISGSYYITGETCFDVAMTDGGTSCGNVADRINDFAETKTFAYSFVGSGVTLVGFAVNDPQAISEGISNSGNLTFIETIRDAARGTTNTDAKSITIYALFKDGSNNKKKVNLTVKIKDCECCGRDGIAINKTIGNNSYLTHEYPTGTNNAVECWMVENSKEGTPTATTYSGRSAGERGYYYYWATATNTNKTISPCPTGWKIPSNSQWDKLATWVNLSTNNASKWWTVNTDNKVYGGYYDVSNKWLSWDAFGIWWSSSETGRRYIGKNNNLSKDLAATNNIMATVRCVQDR